MSDDKSVVGEFADALKDTVDLCRSVLSKLREADVGQMTTRQLKEFGANVTNIQRALSVASKEYRSIEKDAREALDDLPIEEQVDIMIDVIRKLPNHERNRISKSLSGN